MTCNEVRTSLSAMIDRRLREPEQAVVELHMTSCSECRRHERELRVVSLGLREVASSRPPVDLTYRLRVIASHERARMIAGSNWWTTIRFRLNQAIRPLAVPAAGGLLASLLSFAILAPNFTVHASTGPDMPVPLYTKVTIENPSPFVFHGQKDVMVELTVDETGVVSDYSIPTGKLSKDEMRAVGNFLLFTTFRAATVFGHPVSSTLLVNISHMDVGS